MSSATRITSGFAFTPSAMSGRNSETEAEDVTSLLHRRVGRPGSALEREVEARSIARKWRAEARHEGGLRHFLPVIAKRESSTPRTGTDEDDALEEPRSGDLGAYTGVPPVERLNVRGRK